MEGPLQELCKKECTNLNKSNLPLAELIKLKTFSDSRGNLTVIERVIPFEIRRIFYIYGIDKSVRGGHRHKKTEQAVICMKGSCSVFSSDGTEQRQFFLDSADQCLLLSPEDWHQMHNFTDDALLMVLASEPFDDNDYIYEPYPGTLPSELH